jgi:hypothetical protein
MTLSLLKLVPELADRFWNFESDAHKFPVSDELAARSV